MDLLRQHLVFLVVLVEVHQHKMHLVEQVVQEIPHQYRPHKEIPEEMLVDLLEETLDMPEGVVHPEVAEVQHQLLLVMAETEQHLLFLEYQ